MKKIWSFFDIFIKTVSLIGLSLQILPDVDLGIKVFTIYCVLFIAVIILVTSIITYCKKRNQCKRKQLIKRGIDMLSNTKDKIILFGGDLSWANDYLKTIKLLSADNKEIEIHYPRRKYDSIGEDRKREFDERIVSLLAAGAKVFTIPEDYGLRCFIVDPDSSSGNNMQVLLTERLKKDLNNQKRNKYHSQLFCFDNNKHICMLHKVAYEHIKSSRTSISCEDITGN